MSSPVWMSELRTWSSGIDPGLSRLRLAAVAVAAMLAAAAVMAAVQPVGGYPVTVVLFACVLAMISNLSVNEPDLARQRATTALMVLPASLCVVLGTLLAPHRVPADVVFVLVMMTAVYVRRFGPRGTALGMAGFMPYFFTQFLGSTVAQLPWLLLAVSVGIVSTLTMRTWIFAERPRRTLVRLLRAFRARVHRLLGEVDDLLGQDASTGSVQRRLRDLGRARGRLNETALLVADQLARLPEVDVRTGGGPDSGVQDDTSLLVVDCELAAERVAVSTTRMLASARPVDGSTRSALAAGVWWLSRATDSGASGAATAHARRAAAAAVAPVAEDREVGNERAQRVGFAVVRLADALAELEKRVPGRWSPTAGPPSAGSPDPPVGSPPDPVEPAGPPEERSGEPGGEPDTGRVRPGLALATRQAVQVGVAGSLAIVAGELLSPARWYWAVIAAFVVFAGTTSRGDLLNRGLQRVVGTLGGVVAGVGLAALVGGARTPSLVLMFVCVFLALYLVRVSQAMMAFWITAVLALLYGLIGQFSTHTLVVRVEETAAGAVLGMLAGYLILPKRTREAFTEAVEDFVGSADEVLTSAGARLVGRPVAEHPLVAARAMDAALNTLRARVRPLDSPIPGRRGRTSYHRVLQAATAVDHYTRSIARSTLVVTDPSWAATLLPAIERVRANLGLLPGWMLRTPVEDPGRFVSAERLVDAAEEDASRTERPDVRHAQLGVTRMVRRMDQVLGNVAADLGASPPLVSPSGARSRP